MAFGGVTAPSLRTLCSVRNLLSALVAAAVRQPGVADVRISIAMCAAVVCGVANIALIPAISNATSLHRVKSPWDAKIEMAPLQRRRVISLASVFNSCSIVGLVLYAVQFVGVASVGAFRSFLGSVFVRLLPVLVTAVVIYFIKRAWVNPVLARRGSVVEREAFIVWDFFMLFYGVVEGTQKLRRFVSVGVNVFWPGCSVVPGRLVGVRCRLLQLPVSGATGGNAQ